MQESNRNPIASIDTMPGYPWQTGEESFDEVPRMKVCLSRERLPTEFILAILAFPALKFGP